MTQDEFKGLFFEVLERHIKLPNAAQKMYVDVVKRYSAKNRYYHNLNHIISMCSLWKKYHSKLKFPDFVFFAIIYHDIIYKATSSHNEEKSAQYFQKVFFKKFVDLKANEIMFVADLIRYTKHNTFFDKKFHSDIKLFLDFDLMILSSPWEEYLEYTEKIRKEYKIFPNFLYKKGRLDFLESFVKKESIYLSADFKKLEKNARENMKNEIISLNSPKKKK